MSRPSRLALVTLVLGLLAADVEARRGGRRGSIRHYGGAGGGAGGGSGSWSRQYRGGGHSDVTQSRSGDRIDRTGTHYDRRGDYAGETRSSATRDGDDIRTERETTGRHGGSREVTRDIETDDGRVESVKRESELTTRDGETIERSREVERKDGYVEFEGEGKTSTGRDWSAEGYSGRDAYGRRWTSAEVDSKYWGDGYVGRVRGPGGARTVAVGPYGAAAVTRLPSGYRTVTYASRPYYWYGGSYYRPYYWYGVPYYWPMPPPYGAWYAYPPTGAFSVVVGTSTYHCHDHVFYEETNNGGEVGYEVVSAPVGAEVPPLPATHATITLDGQTIHYYANTFYRLVEVDGEQKYVVVAEPQGLRIEQKLPAEFEIVQYEGMSYFRHGEQHFLPYVNAFEEEVYIGVDSPAARPAPAAPATTEPVALTIAAGTELPIRMADALDSATTVAGTRFSGYLDSELRVAGKLALARGSRVFGQVVVSTKAGNVSGTARLVLQLTEVEAAGKTLRLGTEPLALDGESAKSLQKVGVSAGLGAVIGGVAGGGEGAAIGAAVGGGAGLAAAAATPGDQVVIPAQTIVEFRLNQPLEITP